MKTRLFTRSKRQNLVYVMIGIWLVLGIVAIIYDRDLSSLAAYYASGATPVLGYLWSETKRPSEKPKNE